MKKLTAFVFAFFLTGSLAFARTGSTPPPIRALNPQPLPPGMRVALNPQPLPPGTKAPISAPAANNRVNPQPLPPSGHPTVMGTGNGSWK